MIETVGGDPITRTILAAFFAGSGAVCVKVIDKFVTNSDKDTGSILRKQLLDDATSLRKELTEARTTNFTLQKEYITVDTASRSKDAQLLELKETNEELRGKMISLEAELKTLRRIIRENLPRVELPDTH